MMNATRDRSGAALVLLLGTAALTGACSGGGDGDAPDPAGEAFSDAAFGADELDAVESDAAEPGTATQGTDEETTLRGDVFMERSADPQSEFGEYLYLSASFEVPGTGSFGSGDIVEFSERIDGCRIRVTRPDDESEGGGFVSAQRVSAGEVLTFTGPDGTWTELQRSGGADDYDYGGFDLSDMPLPASLVLDVPGDEFPAFAGVSFPLLADPLRMTAPEPGAAVGIDVEYGWVPSDTDGGTVTYLSGGNGERFASVTCDVEETGRFVLPPAVRSALAPFVEGMASYPKRVSMSRSVDAEYRSGSVVLDVGHLDTAGRAVNP